MPPVRPSRRLLALCCALAAGACGHDDGNAPPTAAPGRPSGPLTVFAATSLTEVFEELGQAFEADHDGVTVTFNFAGSSDLARQINEGGRADVFASADEETMAAVTAAGNAAGPRVVARNGLAIIVEKGNPERMSTLADLARPGIVLVLCAPAVPCGRLAAAAFTKARVTPAPASLEENVKAVVSKVTLGEADAGIVYRSDAQGAADEAEGIDIGGGDDGTLQAVYPMAVTTTAANPVTAEAWVDFVLSSRGRRALQASGFLGP
ncbi:MAG: molybdate ABC transporter substrate-binding protein [Acidimicrobiales bacterium]